MEPTMSISTTQPTWAIRKERSIPKLAMPRLRDLDVDVMSDMRPLAFGLIARSLLSVATYVFMAVKGWWILTPAVVWFLYGSTLSAVHHLIHGSLGLSGRARHFWLTVLGCIVVESGHALQSTHVVHHRDGSDMPDPEAYIEYLSWKQMPLGAARYRYRLAIWGWKNSPRRARIGFEMSVHATLHIASLALLPFNQILWIYLTLLHFASFAFAVLQGKGPQVNWGREMHTPLVLIHTKVLPFLFFNHHQHLEHHAYPKVPLTRLAALRPHIEQALETEDVLHVRLAA